MRLASVSAMVMAIGVITWRLIEQETAKQPASLAVLVDGGTEALRTVDRLGKIATQLSIEQEAALGRQRVGDAEQFDQGKPA